jgi:ATP-dependent Clp protease ATP-binding subunit ClpA
MLLMGEKGSGKTFVTKKIAVEYFLKKNNYFACLIDMTNFISKEAFISYVKGFTSRLSPSNIKIIILDNFE